MDTELVELRSYYASPGFILLAHDDLAGGDARPGGCVGVRALAPAVCELRRLFVRPAARGRGLGRRLLENATEQARLNGVSRLVLTTLPTMTEAGSLYAADGYDPIEPYVSKPVEGVQYLGRNL
ncbi:MAG: GNAT family N-acetyltransferase [Intrasporangium sp.]|uniref:GNAT family N-acetyltransferase n=1 Tax=Intrasporangium sp. TaxID=1925024 RepID=UPI002649F4E0|nr:GNAT family N-acetyltransferase [Intrasporangium sp.]MDN5794714.1 GNAT family N-acetyltransferase [Intrasporangium sp.]